MNWWRDCSHTKTLHGVSHAHPVPRTTCRFESIELWNARLFQRLSLLPLFFIVSNWTHVLCNCFSTNLQFARRGLIIAADFWCSAVDLWHRNIETNASCRMLVRLRWLQVSLRASFSLVVSIHRDKPKKVNLRDFNNQVVALVFQAADLEQRIILINGWFAFFVFGCVMKILDCL